MHWSRSDVETFVVQEPRTMYRYRIQARPAERAGWAKNVDIRRAALQVSVPGTQENIG